MQTSAVTPESSSPHPGMPAVQVSVDLIGASYRPDDFPDGLHVQTARMVTQSSGNGGYRAIDPTTSSTLSSQLTL
jgi:hypothetical protein